LTVRVADTGVPEETCSCAGLRLQVGGSWAVPEPWYATEQVRFTIPEKLPAEETWTLAVAEPPTELTVIPVEVVAIETSAPLPLSETVCGELEALSVRVSVPVIAPPAVGENVTEIAQLALAATLVPQVLVSAKFPEAPIEAILRVAFPELVSVIVCAALVEPTP